ncbi:MAG: MFS transporter [Defluviitaleaceae bacterium]|nr:MFS transporter [Defluviitaleaceae bacterium]
MKNIILTFKTNDTSELGLLLVDLAFSIVSIFVSTFLLAHIFILSQESFVTLGLFSLANFIFVFIFQMIGGAVCKRKTPIFVTRLASILPFLLLVLILIMHEHLMYYYIFLGLVWGAIIGFYFSSYQFIIAKKTKGEKMLKFLALYTSIVSILQFIFPVTFGLIIEHGSFFHIIMAVLAVVIFQILATFLIKHEPKIEKSTKLDFKSYFSAVKQENHLKQTIQLWLIIFLTGFADIISALTTAFVMISFNSHLNLGILISVFSLVKAITSYIYRKFPNLRNVMFWISIVTPVISVLLLLIYQSPFWVILFMGIRTLTRGFIFMEEEKTRLSATSYWSNGEKFVMESNLFYETSLGIGAIFSALLLILIGRFYYQWLVLIFLVITVLAFSVHGVLIKAWQKNNKNIQT